MHLSNAAKAGKNETLTSNLTMKSEEIKTMQADLDQGFLQAAKDLFHFPEESLELAKMLVPPTLLKYWKEKSFKDFKVQKELFGENHRVSKVQRQEGGCCTVLKEVPVNERTRKEVNREAARMIEHPNIMPLSSMFFEESDRISSVFIEMPYCVGGGIVDYVFNVQPGLSRVRVILIQVLDALTYMLTKKLVHGVLKPENILMSTTCCMTSQPKVADFDLSRGHFTLSLVGGGDTQGFMAPELLNSLHAVPTVASDMWTFGRVLQLVKEALREVDKNLSIKEGLDDLIQQLMVTIQASDRCQLARKLTGFSCTLKLLRQNARVYVVATLGSRQEG
jgi:serine/threonine protein kinase